MLAPECKNNGGYVMRKSARTLACIASLVAITAAAMLVPAASQQQPPATKVTPLMKEALPEFPGHEVTILTLDIPPGVSSPAHRHPGHHVFGYVLEGSYKIKVDQGPERVLTKGQTFHEAPGQLHAVSANASQTEPAKVVVFMVLESGKPITVPEKQ
jgi:quercetin dioxygenase-like cupin family protein